MDQRNLPPGGARPNEAILRAVWQKAKPVAFADRSVMREDACGAYILWSAYGKTEDFGWEIDHERPVSKGGTDDLDNLQPLQWENNRRKSDKWPWSYEEAA